MEIFLASDHAGFELKEHVKQFLSSQGHAVLDCGPVAFNADDDYPVYVTEAAKRISRDPEHKAIVFGKTGQGEAMQANRFEHVRAAVYYGGPEEILVLSRQHNDANVLSLGADFLSKDEAERAVTLWLATTFSGEERHQRRITEIDNYEK